MPFYLCTYFFAGRRFHEAKCVFVYENRNFNVTLCLWHAVEETITHLMVFAHLLAEKSGTFILEQFNHFFYAFI